MRDEILAQGGRAWFYRADVSVAEQAKPLVEFAAGTCGGLGIRVNCVSPGTVLTPSLEGRIAASPDPEKAREEFLSRQPMHRLLTPGEVADASLYLAGDSALSVTGFNLVLDGGMTM